MNCTLPNTTAQAETKRKLSEAPLVPAHKIAGLPDSFYATAATAAKQITFPTTQVKTREDIPNFLAEMSYEDLCKLYSAANNVKQELPAIVSLVDMEEMDIPEPQVLIEGLLHQGEKMVLSGASKSNKTWSLIDLGLSIASGKDWWGRKTSQGKVLYINFEIPDFHMRQRCLRISEAKEIGKEHRANFDIYRLRGHAADFATLRDTITIQAGNNYKLIIIDPIYKGLGGRDENKAGDMAGLLNEFEKLAVSTGAAVAFGHHYSKGNQAAKDPMDRMGGSGVLARDPDTVMSVTKHEQEDAYTVECLTRNFPRPEAFCVKWEHPLMCPDKALNPADLKQLGVKPKKYHETDTLAVLGLQSLTYTEWFEQTRAKSKISESMFRNHKKYLERSKQVEKTTEGKYLATATTAK